MADKTATSELDELYTASRTVRRRQEGQWLLNMAYYDSRQWCAYDGVRVFEPELEPYRVKLVDNRIRGIVGTRTAKMTKTRPQWVAVPSTSDDDAIASARTLERALDSRWNALKLTRKLRSALTWSGVTTAGLWKLWWDSALGDSTEILVYTAGHDQAGQPVARQGGGVLRADDLENLPAEYAEQVQVKRVATGEICVDLRNPFQVFPDALATEEGLESAGHIIDEGIYSRDYLRERFGDDAVRPLSDDSSSTEDSIQARLPGGSSLLEDRGAPGNRGIRVREFWARPSSTFPNGKRCVWAQDHVLHEEDNPYPWLPFVMFSGIPVPGRFWPSCVTTDLISPQTELNKRRSQIAENAERFGNPALMRSSMNVDVEWHGLPGEELVFEDYGTPGAVPQFLQPPEMPGYVQTDIDRNENSIREVSGQHEVSSGQVPTGVTAASAINLLQEQDDTRLGPDIADMEGALEQAGERMAWLMSRYYDDERMIRLAGADGAWDIEAFRGEQLKGYAAVEVQSGSGLPQSKAAKQAAIQQTLNLFVQNNVAVDQRQLRRVLREFEIGGLEAFFADVDHDEEQINDEHRRALNGDDLVLNSYDNDDLHIQGHEDFQKTSRYRNAVAQDPSFGQAFEQHVQEHRDRKTQQALASASQQQPFPASGQPAPDVTQQPLPPPPGLAAAA